MTNRKAKYDDEKTLKIIREWFENQGTFNGNLKELYQSYYEYVVAPEYVFERMDIHTFAKCLVACRIIEVVQNHWALRENYTPKRYEIVKATA